MLKIALVVDYNSFSKYSRILSALPDTDWVGCYFEGGVPEDAGLESCPVRIYRSADMLYEKAEAVIVACPMESRFEHSSHAIRKACSVWSPFPIGSSMGESAKLVSLAHEARVCNQVGHLYRMDPLLEACQGFLDGLRLVRTEIIYREDTLSHLDVYSKVEFLLFPYLDRVLSLISTGVKKIHCHWLPYPQNGEGLVVVEFDSGQYAEFWIERGLESQSAMHLLGTDFCVDVDFSEMRLDVYNRKDGRKVDVSSWMENTVGRQGPLQQDLSDFVRKSETRDQARMSFSDSMEVQDIIAKVKRTIQRYG